MVTDLTSDMELRQRAWNAAAQVVDPEIPVLTIADLGVLRDVSVHDGEIEIAGPTLAQSVTELVLIDEYRIYLHPVVLGHGKPYFAGPRPPLRLKTHDRIGEDVIRLTYVPA